MPERLQQLERWLRGRVGADFDIEPASSDASFRRYFRVRYGGESRIVMDAPPEREDVRPYIDVARRFRALGLNVPEVLDHDPEQGFVLLGDLGSTLYLDALDEASVERLYGDALGALAALQATGPREGELPAYDRALLMREMALFRDWYLERHRGLELSEAERRMLEQLFDVLAQSALEQPRVAVHRDYHSRNLLVAEHNPGIVDFQDAVIGPVTYDPVSLLRDCYIAWPRERVEEWALGYHDLALHSGILREANERGFLRWFDLMGVQRHLKAVGIFARLNHRDGKPGYLADIPRVLGYLEDVSGRHPELAGLHTFLQERVLPSSE